ncbi:N6-adenosine-methyltransferase non-catalytic subunit MTB-like [Tasmannia lanceolata]|uniref:N6-adenosine-methyltransferase non-catalytic subunit MTB-like n=1 Tax=Tasmannia lanceolata TaxID=3420 RepID=UPI0040644498
MGTGPNHAMYFNQLGPGRGVSPSVTGPGFNIMGPIGRGVPHDNAPMGWCPPRTSAPPGKAPSRGEQNDCSQNFVDTGMRPQNFIRELELTSAVEVPHDNAPMGWGPPRISAPPGKAPSRGEQNDYSQNFVDTGMRPQNFIRELELTSVVEDYPKLRELFQRKDEIVAKSASPPMYYKCDLREHVLSPEFFGTKFDVILVDPPWEEYVHRAHGVTDHMEYWTPKEIQNLKIEAIADTPSFIFLWVGDGVGLEQGRLCLKKWGFRRCEDICWVRTNRLNATPGPRHYSHTLFQPSKEHCLMGIKGTVRGSTDSHVIHANIDPDIIIDEEPPDEYGAGGHVSTAGDVYSYGILLLEIFVGKRPTDDMFKDGLSLHKFVQLSLPNRVMEILDPLILLEDDEERATNIAENYNDKIRRLQECLVSLVRTGVVCSAESPRERMEMADVVKEMCSIRNIYLGAGIHRE